MSTEEQRRIIIAKKRDTLAKVVEAVSNFAGIKALAASRIATAQESLLSVDPRDTCAVSRLQGQAAESRFWLNLGDNIAAELDAATNELSGSSPNK